MKTRRGSLGRLVLLVGILELLVGLLEFFLENLVSELLNGDSFSQMHDLLSLVSDHVLMILVTRVHEGLQDAIIVLYQSNHASHVLKHCGLADHDLLGQGEHLVSLISLDLEGLDHSLLEGDVLVELVDLSGLEMDLAILTTFLIFSLSRLVEHEEQKNENSEKDL